LPDGTIWIARGGKLSEFIDGRFVQDHIPPDVRDSYVQGICPGIDGGIWIVSEGRTRKCQDGSWTADLGVLPWEATPFMSFIQTKSKKLLAGTADHGMYVIGTETGTTVEHFDRLNGLASD